MIYATQIVGKSAKIVTIAFALAFMNSLAVSKPKACFVGQRLVLDKRCIRPSDGLTQGTKYDEKVVAVQQDETGAKLSSTESRVHHITTTGVCRVSHSAGLIPDQKNFSDFCHPIVPDLGTLRGSYEDDFVDGGRVAKFDGHARHYSTSDLTTSISELGCFVGGNANKSKVLLLQLLLSLKLHCSRANPSVVGQGGHRRRPFQTLLWCRARLTTPTALSGRRHVRGIAGKASDRQIHTSYGLVIEARVQQDETGAKLSSTESRVHHITTTGLSAGPRSTGFLILRNLEKVKRRTAHCLDTFGAPAVVGSWNRYLRAWMQKYRTGVNQFAATNRRVNTAATTTLKNKR
ncbi:hypothetical protein GPALN_012113 [Globodera pallida]|nr:hypothetical protein GPALN_012113 [Globodera pallida]